MRTLESLAAAGALALAPGAAQAAEPQAQGEFQAQGETLLGLGITIVEDDRQGITGEFGFRVEGVLTNAGPLKDLGIAIEPTLHATVEFNEKDNKPGALMGAAICVGPTLDLGEKDGVKLIAGVRAEVTGPSTLGPKGWDSAEVGPYVGFGFSVAEARVTDMVNVKTGLHETKLMLEWSASIF